MCLKRLVLNIPTQVYCKQKIDLVKYIKSDEA